MYIHLNICIGVHKLEHRYPPRRRKSMSWIPLQLSLDLDIIFVMVSVIIWCHIFQTLINFILGSKKTSKYENLCMCKFLTYNNERPDKFVLVLEHSVNWYESTAWRNLWCFVGFKMLNDWVNYTNKWNHSLEKYMMLWMGNNHNRELKNKVT